MKSILTNIADDYWRNLDKPFQFDIPVNTVYKITNVSILQELDCSRSHSFSLGTYNTAKLMA